MLILIAQAATSIGGMATFCASGDPVLQTIGLAAGKIWSLRCY